MSKDSIVAKALELFSTKGYDGTSMEDIAKAVGIKKASIYAHFPGKEQIFTAAMQSVIDEYEAFTRTLTRMDEGEEPTRKLRDLFVRYVKYSCDNPKMEFWDRFYYHPPAFTAEAIRLLTRSIEHRLMSEIAEIVDRGVRRGEIVDKNVFDITQSYYYMMVGLALATKFYEAAELEDVAGRSADVFLEGVRRRD